ncbi:CoxG family protein [Acuticoccus sp. I52.16.1]|uniref:CoxG family protein n=1 Tax=Acuticoccus sp. I52.16.1 TaxID=2928472 RepID=UPI001FD5145F|nr:carbon monoxide dehydrogenase subunit G [Acuticoccus sp. I52.16.1]UOM36419.1 carbon monoxide dehydrogenase subunit G [Acuticoccus sp. I52.16.1]
MEMTGEHRIPAPRKVVWEALHDPEILKDCIKGCQTLEKKSDHEMVARVQAKVGPVKATFDADVEIVNENAPASYTLQGEGKGGVAGFAKGKADVQLAEDGENATILTYQVDAKVGGKLAQLGSRLVDTTAKKYAADFFEEFCAKLSAPPPRTMSHADTVVDAPVDPAVIAGTAGRIEPQRGSRAELARNEFEDAGQAGISALHPEDSIETQLEVASAKRIWGGAWFWGVLAFAAVLLILVALG